MSFQNLPKTKGLYRVNSNSLPQRRPVEYATITTPNLLDLQLNLPDPINRQTFSVVRGVKIPSSYTQPNLTLYHPPSQKTSQSAKLQHSSLLQPSLPHRQYTAPEFGTRQKLATNTLQQRPHSHYNTQQRTSSSNLSTGATSSEDQRRRLESKTPFYTRETKLSENVEIPGVPVIYRSDEVKKLSPDRLNLENRHLTVMPIFEKEEQLRLLNLQMNMISRIQHLSPLRNLIFLDLYDNLISEITGLDCLVSLRVLMLGKNRIKMICGLGTLKKLDVLDLHGNLIREIENLSGLTTLRVLNLAGNELNVVSGMENLVNLTELNFRRNKIHSVDGLNELPQLQRLFLSHNNITDFESLNNCLASTSLKELSLDNNPVEHNAFYKPIVLKRCPTLHLLDGSPLNEEERKVVLAGLKKLEAKKDEENRQVLMKARREQTLVALRDNFLNLHPHLKLESYYEQSCGSKGSNTQVADCIYEITGEDVKFYGVASLEYLEKAQHHGIKAIIFSYIDFDTIVPYLSKFKTKVPDVKRIEFYFTNIDSFNQINAMQYINMNIKDLVISEEGNPIASSHILKSYVAFRLRNLKLETLNNQSISKSDIHPSFLFSEKTSKFESAGQDRDFVNYLDYCTEIIPETYPKQLKEANKISNKVVENSLNRKSRDNCFNALWSQVFTEAILANLDEMENMEDFTRKHLFQ